MKLNRLDSAINRENRAKLNENMSIIENDFSTMNMYVKGYKETVEENSRLVNQANLNASEAVILANAVQDELDSIVVEGDSSVEAAQARTNSDTGETYNSLRARLDNENKILTQKLSNYANKVVYVDVVNYTDYTSELLAMINDNDVAVIDLANRIVTISSKIEVNKTIIRNGTIYLKNNGQLNPHNFGELVNVKVIVDVGSFTATSAILFDKMNGKASDIRLVSSLPAAINAIGVHFKGTPIATCFNEVINSHITYFRTGLFIDSTTSWVTAITCRNIRVDYFEEYALRIGALSGDQQNSQHNISDIIIHDTSDSTEASNRIGFSIGGTWNNISNIVTFADRHAGTFTPLEIPPLRTNTPAYLLAVLATTIANKVDGVVLENDPNCRGLEYLHELKSIRSVRSNKYQRPNGTSSAISFADTTEFSPYTLENQMELHIPASQQALINAGHVSQTFTDGVLTITNNRDVALYFNYGFKIKKSSKLLTAKYFTFVLKSNISVACSLKNKNDQTVTAESALKFIDVEGGSIYAYANQVDANVLATLNDASDDLILNVGSGTLPARAVVKITNLHHYDKLVPIINKNTQHLLNDINYLS